VVDDRVAKELNLATKTVRSVALVEHQVPHAVRIQYTLEGVEEVVISKEVAPRGRSISMARQLEHGVE
jgi:hypothetical protein